MRQTELIMGMPINVEISDADAKEISIKKVFDYFKSVDEKFSTYKTNSEISRINRGEIKTGQYSDEVKEIFFLAQKTKIDTNGYFDINHKGQIDPSGLVKGWAINNAAQLLHLQGYKNFYIEAGGDVQTSGTNSQGQLWSVGIKNPFNQTEIVKILQLSGQGVATSGNYIRGNHIYNPKSAETITEIVSITVIAKNVYEADRFATAAFAMGKDGINFIESQKGLEGYLIDKDAVATMTSGFEKLTI